MRVLVTGGAGFIGSSFVRLGVKRGLEITVVDKLTYAGDLKRIKEAFNRIKFYQVDISNREELEEMFKKEEPKIIVHFAAETHVDRSILSPQDFVKTNVFGTESLLELSLQYEVERFIHISTDEVYGDLPNDRNLKFKETDYLRPSSPYSATKAASDMLVQAFYRTYGLPSIIVRASNNYGYWQYPEKLIPLTIAKTLQNEKIPVYGKGENIRTWLFVDDCSEAVFSLLDRGKVGEIYNVGSGEERRNTEVIKTILELLKKEESLIEYVPDRPGHDFRYAVDTGKIEKEIGWRPRVNFEEGIERTLRWYIENREWLFRKKGEVENFVENLKRNYRKYEGSPFRS